MHRNAAIAVSLLLALAAAGAAAAQAPLAAARGEWQAVEAVAPGQQLRLTLTLRQRNLAELDRRFWAVSDPLSPEYGKFLTHSELADLIAPPAADVRRVQAFLRDTAGCAAVQTVTTRDIVVCHDIPAQRVREVFAVDLFWYARGADRHVRAPPGRPGAIPAAIADVVEAIPELDDSPVADLLVHTEARVNPAPTSASQAVRPPRKVDAKGPPYNPPLTPDQLRDLYNVSAALVGNNSKAVAQAVMTTGSYSPTDLRYFLGNFTPVAISEDIKEVVNFTNSPTNPQIEPDVDVEWTMGMGPKVYTYLWGLTGSFLRGDAWVNIAVSYFTTPEPPALWTVSYNAGLEAGQTQNTNIDRMNVEFQKVGATGGTLVFSSGDKGAGCNPQDPNQVFQLQFPSSSPYITVVGATKTNDDGTQEACAISAGGFSNLYPRPPYQATVVNQYLQGPNLPPAALYNSTGRAIPDVAVEGCDARFYWSGMPLSLSGTSVSTPMLAGLLSLLNVQRTARGLPVLGFANPLLYTAKAVRPQAFHDITVGNSNRPSGCTSMGWNQGWNAAAGWNPVTGLGSPNFGILSELALTLPRRFNSRQ